MRRYLWIMLLWLVACRAESPPIPTPALAEAVPNSAPVRIGINQEGKAWYFQEAPPLPANSILIEETDGFALDPTWEIATIEYDYDWGGLGFYRDRANQRIIRNGDTFLRDEQPIAKADIENFILSISGFHPSQYYSAGTAWTDDYPSHAILVVGTDGQQLVIRSSSTGNPGDGPWNLIYNQQL